MAVRVADSLGSRAASLPDRPDVLFQACEQRLGDVVAAHRDGLLSSAAVSDAISMVDDVGASSSREIRSCMARLDRMLASAAAHRRPG